MSDRNYLGAPNRIPAKTLIAIRDELVRSQKINPDYDLLDHLQNATDEYWPAPADQMRVTDRDDGVTIGIAMSVAFLLRDRDDPVPALEWWNAAGLTIEQCERVGLDEYDLAPIRAAISTATEGSGE